MLDDRERAKRKIMAQIKPTHPQQTSQAMYFIVAIVVFLFLLVFGACAERETPPTTCERLEGAWIRTWEPNSSTQTYSFHSGQCLIHSIIPAQPVQLYVWEYYCEGDTLTLVNLASATPFSDIRRAVVSFPTDSTCVLGWVWGVDYQLKRL